MKGLRFLLIMTLITLFGESALQAQTTEKFNDESDGAGVFSEGGLTFNTTDKLKVDYISGYGYDDNYFISNFSSAVIEGGSVGSFTNSSNNFKVYELYIIPLNSAQLVEQYNDILIKGKLDGSTQFTHTVYWNTFNTGSTNNYYTYVNLSSYSSYTLDELEFIIDPYDANNIQYLMIDDFQFSPVAAVTFTDGSSYTPSITKGSTFQPLGRFELTGNIAGALLTTASIKINGTRTGLSNLKLWSSTDATFNSSSDSQVGLTVGADPGNGNLVTFNSFSSSIGTGGMYYFLTSDVASDATGSVQGVIVANTNLTISNGSLSGTLSNEPLSNGDASLPVDLSSFSARCEGRSIVLNWITESETDNLGFILERSVETQDFASLQWQTIASFQTHNELKGQGNTSGRMEYSFTDANVESGQSYSYRLSDVSTKGEIAAYASLSAEMNRLPETTEMKNAYPNPFNPQTYIAYQLAEDVDVNISVYDLLGRQVKLLFNGNQLTGTYHVYWNAMNETGNKVPSGSYMIRMRTADRTQIQKVMLMK